LETRLRELARGPFGNRQSKIANRKWIGAAAGNRTRLVAVRKHSPWQEDILLLNHSRENKKSRERSHAPGPLPFQQRTNTSW
jgi:hypothetical protein